MAEEFGSCQSEWDNQKTYPTNTGGHGYVLLGGGAVLVTNTMDNGMSLSQELKDTEVALDCECNSVKLTRHA